MYIELNDRCIERLEILRSVCSLLAGRDYSLSELIEFIVDFLSQVEFDEYFNLVELVEFFRSCYSPAVPD